MNSTDARTPRSESSAAWIVDRIFSRTPASVTAIRTWARDQLVTGPASRVVEIAELLVSEIATNAVLHGAGKSVRVQLVIDGQLEVSVHDDGSSALPRLGSPAVTDDGGRGLTLVRALSAGWGTRVGSSGKWVWFRLSLA